MAVSLVCAILLLSAFFIDGVVSPSTTLQMPLGIDLENVDEGSIIMRFQISESNLLVDGEIADEVLMFYSEKLPALTIRYDTRFNHLTYGLPVERQTDLNLFDGTLHELVYTYNKEEAVQKLFLDGNQLAESRYTGQPPQEFLTGLAIGKISEVEVRDLNIEIEVE